MSHLESGSVVWVRLGQAWWPGSITTIAKCPPEFLESIRKTPIAIVKFFHENEYQDVHKEEHIFPYNCDRKEEFIRKGQAVNKNQSHGDVDLLAKFESDVVTAEKLTGGDMDILRTLVEGAGKRRIDYSDLGFGPPKLKKKREDGANRQGSDIGQAVVYKRTGGRGGGRGGQRMVIEHRVRIMEQLHRENSDDDMKAAASWFKCQQCGFTCTRLNVIVWHNKAHLSKVCNYDSGIKVPGRKRRRRAGRDGRKKGKECKGKENMDHAHTNGDVSGGVGGKKDMQDTQQILMDWDDEDDAEGGELGTPQSPGNKEVGSDGSYSDVDDDYPPPQPRYERRPMPKADDLNSAFDALLAGSQTHTNLNTSSSSGVNNYINNDSDSDYSDWEKYYERDSGSGTDEEEEREQESDIKSLCEANSREGNDKAPVEVETPEHENGSNAHIEVKEEKDSQEQPHEKVEAANSPPRLTSTDSLSSPPRPDLTPEPEPEPKLEILSEAEPELQPKPEPELQPEIKQELESQPKSELEKESELQPKLEQEPELQSEPEPQQESKQQLELQPELEQEMQPEQEQEPELQPKPEPQPEQEPELQHEPEPEPEPDPDPEPKQIRDQEKKDDLQPETTEQHQDMVEPQEEAMEVEEVEECMVVDDSTSNPPDYYEEEVVRESPQAKEFVTTEVEKVKYFDESQRNSTNVTQLSTCSEVTSQAEEVEVTADCEEDAQDHAVSPMARPKRDREERAIPMQISSRNPEGERPENTTRLSRYIDEFSETMVAKEEEVITGPVDYSRDSRQPIEILSSPKPHLSDQDGPVSASPVRSGDLAATSGSGTTYMLVAVDAHGNTVPTVPTPALSESGSDLVAVEATMEDGTTRTLYIDPAHLGPNVDLSNLMLHIDTSGQEHVIIPSSSSSDSEGPHSRALHYSPGRNYVHGDYESPASPQEPKQSRGQHQDTCKVFRTTHCPPISPRLDSNNRVISGQPSQPPMASPCPAGVEFESR